MYDLIIVGGGPAGLTAALYARRANKTVLVLEKDSFGGQITYSPRVENIPGFPSVSGSEFADRLVEQVLAQGAEAESCEVTGITDDPAESVKVVHTDMGDYTARAVILAVGARHRSLGLPGEEDYLGAGISFCAVCDGAFYEGKVVGIAGGGNSALQEALLLADLAREVHVIQNLDALTGEAELRKRLASRTNVRVHLGTVISAYRGNADGLTGVVLKSSDGSERELPLDGLFLAVGLEPQKEPFASLVPLDERGYIDSDERCLTGTPGVFAAGDCRRKAVRQVTTAASDGAAAALAACTYLDSAEA